MKKFLKKVASTAATVALIPVKIVAGIVLASKFGD
jgi:uncharacterized membrane protein YwzB